MNQIVSKGIVLTRVDYGEADRIVTLLTPDHGKIRVMARGVRKIKSRMAGGVELFSVSDITYMAGRGEIGTLVSARLITHYGNIVHDINRVQQGYELIKMVNKTTEDDTDQSYFDVLIDTLKALDNNTIPLDLTRQWLQAQLLNIGGHQPNMLTDTAGQELVVDQLYEFDFETMCFRQHSSGLFGPAQIKALRLLFSNNKPLRLVTVQGLIDQLPTLDPILRYMTGTFLRV